MKKALIEKYPYEGAGYRPLLIRPGWQIARLNFMPRLTVKRIKRFDCHQATDEAFVLVKGRSVLLAARETAKGLVFTAVLMAPGVTYNIPKGVWHNIVMKPGDVVMIIEKDNTHLNDAVFRDLDEREHRAFQAAVEKALGEN